MPVLPCQRASGRLSGFARSVRAFAALVSCFSLLGGCDGACGGAPARLRVGGETAYVRCLAVDPPAPRRWKVGELTLELEERSLRIGGFRSHPRLAFAAGPAPFRVAKATSTAELSRGGADLIVIVGGLGDDVASARTTLELLATIGAPVLVLAGGRDSYRVLSDAFAGLPSDARDRVLDARGVSSVILPPGELVLLSGAPDGRYARSDDACGFSAEDLEARVGELGRGGDRLRYLVTWAAPAGGRLSRGFDEVEAGNEAVAAFREAIGASGVVHVFPGTQAGRSAPPSGKAPSGSPVRDLEIALPKMAGGVVERADESVSRADSVHVVFRPEGLSIAPRAPEKGRADQP